MNRLLLVLFSAFFLSLPAVAQSRHVYDYKTGNSYSVQERWDGSTHVNGFNARTGSTWNTDIRPNGDMSGRDSNNNYWNYNRSSGSYHNSDGTNCFGKGAFRTCN